MGEKQSLCAEKSLLLGKFSNFLSEGSFGWLLIGSPGPEDSKMHGKFPFVL